MKFGWFFMFYLVICYFALLDHFSFLLVKHTFENWITYHYTSVDLIFSYSFILVSASLLP